MPPSTDWPFLTRLVQAILSRVRSREGYVNKTKLLKYLYLIDIEHYRLTGEILTGFQWIFYKFGPWTHEYEELYAYLQHPSVDAIEVRSTDRESEILTSRAPVELSDLFDPITEESRVRRIIDLWADRKLGEMLDYVYFHTEPMENAVRNEPLDFGTIRRRDESATTLPPAEDAVLASPSPDRWEEPKAFGVAPKVMLRTMVSPVPAAAREGLRAIIRAKTEPQAQTITPPRYDEVFFTGLSVLDDDTDY